MTIDKGLDDIEPSNSHVFSDNNVDKSTVIDTEQIEIDAMKRKIIGVGGGTADDNVNNGPVIQEGFESSDGIAHFRREDWTGQDNINDEGAGEGEDFRQIIVDYINYFYDYILFVEQFISYEITKVLSRGDFQEQDVDVVKKYVTWFFAICVSCVIVYNWFYVMFYRNAIDQKVYVPEFSRKNVKDYATVNSIVRLIEPFVTFALFFPEYLQKVFMEWVPDRVAMHFNPTLQFSLLFFFIVYVLYNFSNSFRQLFIDIIMLNTNDWVISMMYIVVVILFLIYFVFDMMWSVEAKVPFFNIFYFLKNLIYFLIIMAISPFLGGMMCMGIIIFFSLFATGAMSWREIDEYTKTARRNMKEEGVAEGLTFFEKIKNFFNGIFDYIHTFVFQTAFLFMVIWSFSDYTHNIKSDTLKNSLFIINALLLFCIPAFTISQWLYGFKIDTERTFDEVHSVAAEPPISPSIPPPMSSTSPL